MNETLTLKWIDDLGSVDLCVGGDLPGYDRDPRIDQCFATDPRVRILCNQCIEYRIGNLVGHLVWMAFRNRLRSKQKTAWHGASFGADQFLSENKPSDFIRPPQSKVIRLVVRPRF